MCFIMNIIISGQKFFSPSYLLYIFNYCQNMFLNRNLSPNMPKNALILLKNRKKKNKKSPSAEVRSLT